MVYHEFHFATFIHCYTLQYVWFNQNVCVCVCLCCTHKPARRDIVGTLASYALLLLRMHCTVQCFRFQMRIKRSKSQSQRAPAKWSSIGDLPYIYLCNPSNKLMLLYSLHLFVLLVCCNCNWSMLTLCDFFLFSSDLFVVLWYAVCFLIIIIIIFFYCSINENTKFEWFFLQHIVSLMLLIHAFMLYNNVYMRLWRQNATSNAVQCIEKRIDATWREN